MTSVGRYWYFWYVKSGVAEQAKQNATAWKDIFSFDFFFPFIFHFSANARDHCWSVLLFLASEEECAAFVGFVV